MSTYFEEVFNNFKGQKILDIQGLAHGSEKVVIIFETGIVTMHHIQDCCESVHLEDYQGDPEDLIGKVLVSAEETSEIDDVCMSLKKWTFYSIRTTGDDLWLRWFGSSNGYYSVSVDTTWKPNNAPT